MYKSSSRRSQAVYMERYALRILVICASAQSSLADKQYRRDYEYNAKTDAFYKLHIEPDKHEMAQKKCESEGASLSDVSQDDIRQIHSMIKKFPVVDHVVHVASDGEQHEPLDEEPMVVFDDDVPPLTADSCDALTGKGEVVTVPCFRHAPFVCKVDAQHAYYDNQCDVYGKGYISKVSTTGSCYKISEFAATWNEAYAHCDAERAHLAVLNSENEKEEVKGLMQAAGDVARPWPQSFFFVGIRAPWNKDSSAPKHFNTVLNQTLEEAGFVQWSDSPTPPKDYLNEAYCGSLYKENGMYYVLVCFATYGFICEKERQWGIS